MKRYYWILSFFLLLKPAFGQGEAAMQILEFQQSPLLQGAGQIGVSIPMSDPAGFYFNPAQLGYFSRENNFSILTLPQKTNWGGNLFQNRISFQTFGMTAGYNFKKENNNLPLSLGLGYIHNVVNYGSPKVYDSFDCFSVGASYNYYLLFNLGFSLKPYNSLLSDQTLDGKTLDASGTAFDFGALIVAPVSQLLFNDSKYNLDEKNYIKPKFDFSLGYSVLNIGKKISYIDAAQADPIPRTARLGYTFNFGLDLFTSKNELNAINYSFTAEAEDLLIKEDFVNGSHYENILGNINFGKNLIGLKSDQNVVVHKGHIFKLFETLIVTSGRYYGENLNNIKTNGFGFSSEGVSKLLSTSMENSVINFVANHFVIEYYHTNLFADSNLETNVQGIAFYFKNIGL
jgi:hypothetical protein